MFTQRVEEVPDCLIRVNLFFHSKNDSAKTKKNNEKKEEKDKIHKTKEHKENKINKADDPKYANEVYEEYPDYKDFRTKEFTEPTNFHVNNEVKFFDVSDVIVASSDCKNFKISNRNPQHVQFKKEHSAKILIDSDDFFFF